MRTSSRMAWVLRFMVDGGYEHTEKDCLGMLGSQQAEIGQHGIGRAKDLAKQPGCNHRSDDRERKEARVACPCSIRPVTILIILAATSSCQICARSGKARDSLITSRISAPDRPSASA